MKMKAMLIALVLVTLAIGTVPALAQAQTEQPQKQQKSDAQKKKKKNGQQVAASSATAPASERLEPDDENRLPTDVPEAAQANRRGQMSEEEAAVLPYYNNFLTSYRLGPEDVISVSVFGQERYSKSGIIIPPNGKISYPLIPEGIFVAGKTTEQVQEELTKKLDEYIIDPKITVSLDKAMSARYSVLGDVGQPGIRIMTHRLSVYEALAESGGVLETGDKSKVMVLRRQADGTLASLRVNIKKYERGDAKEIVYLVPGDQVIVPGNTFKKFKEVMNMLPILSFARIFTGGW